MPNKARKPFPPVTTIPKTLARLWNHFAQRYEMKMIFCVVLLLLLISTPVQATSPATFYELDKETMSELGFKLEQKTILNQTSITLTAPVLLNKFWYPVTTQVHVTEKANNFGSLSKVQLGKPIVEPILNIYYYPEFQDVMFGVYYLCDEDIVICGGEKQRFYYFDYK